MIIWQDPAIRQSVKIFTDPVEHIMNNYLDMWTWWLLQTWYMPFKIPALHNDAEKFVSTFTLNGARAARAWNMCRPG